MQASGWPRFTPVADHALLVSFGEVIGEETSAAVRALDQALAHAPCAGFIECVPAMVSLLVDFDPLLTDHDQVRAHVQALLRDPPAVRSAGRLHAVEVCYDPDFAPDLPAVAQASGLSVEQVIERHAQAILTVRMYGFAPGFAYLSGVPAEIQVPRKPAATRGIPAGSVLMAGPQCLVTTLVMPTGWSVIGRSPTRILDPDSPAPFLFEVGDSVRFVRIDRDRYEARCTARDDG
jgi:inhibitor of KinA